MIPIGCRTHKIENFFLFCGACLETFTEEQPPVFQFIEGSNSFWHLVHAKTS